MTTGGPGDACQCPDSESAVALLESFTELWNHTRDPRWVAAARAAAMLVSTWIMPYDFVFPPGTEFARLGLRTTGTVFANVQNKHSAPGFCTYAGTGLLRLFRATGEIRWLRLLAQVTRALPQFVSRPDRPIHAPDGRPLPSGWINERVNTSDWDDNPGGVFYGSCWCEVSLLLTAAELPGIYAQPDTGVLQSLDHVSAEWADAARTELRVHNPTQFLANATIAVESAEQAAAEPWGDHAARRLPRVILPPGTRATLSLSSLRPANLSA